MTVETYMNVRLNNNFLLLQTKGDGNCMLNAVLESCEFLDESDRKKFGAHQLLLAVINHIIDQ